MGARGYRCGGVARIEENQKKTGNAAHNKMGLQREQHEDAGGYVVMGDQRSKGNGWGHHASQVPTVIGDCLYVPTMAGTVYVIRWDSEVFDENTIVAINDLGPVGESWNRASLSFANDSLFAHTIDGLICIGN